MTGERFESARPRNSVPIHEGGCVRRTVSWLTIQRSLLIAVGMLLLAPTCSEAQTTLGTQTLTLNLGAASALYGFPNTVSLINTGSAFNSYTGSLTVRDRARTSSSGTGSITLRATSDFPCASGGPCILTPPSAGDALTYTCTGATLGSNCSGTQTVSTGGSTNVVTNIPASATSPSDNTVSLSFSLTNDPKYKTGNYSATLTFTISAT